MSFNLVTLHGQWTDGTNYAEGNFLFDADGDLVQDPSTAIVTPVVRGSLDSQGRLWDGKTQGSGVSLLASDNFLDGQLTWHILLRIQGWGTADVADVPVNFTLGASQGIFGVLEAAGWSHGGDGGN